MMVHLLCASCPTTPAALQCLNLKSKAMCTVFDRVSDRVSQCTLSETVSDRVRQYRVFDRVRQGTVSDRVSQCTLSDRVSQ